MGAKARGGDWEGYRFADANFDWGQGALSAFAAADEKGLSPVAYFSTGTVFMGIPRDRAMLNPPPFTRADAPSTRVPSFDAMLARMQGRFVAVPLRFLHGPIDSDKPVPIFRALRATPPAGRLTKLYVYYDLRDPERFAALEQWVHREIPLFLEEWEAKRREGRPDPGPFAPEAGR